MSADSVNDDIAAVVGNGFSIAFNPALRLPDLTKEIAHRIDASAGGADVASALAGLSGVDDGVGDDFEQLVGPLDDMGETLRRLADVEKVLPATGGLNVPGSITDLSDYLDQVRRVGVSHALQTIDERATATLDEREFIDAFVAEVCAGAGAGRVTLGTLNYDGLLLAASMDSLVSKCDMADGRQTSSVELFPGDDMPWGVSAHALRKNAVFPAGRRLRLLSLHGSVTWLRHRGTADVRKFSHEALRNADYWERWRRGESDWEPEVVLTNQEQKSSLTSRWPFSVAYEELRRSLLRSDRWLIVGYSFKDGPVNELLREVLAERRDDPPLVLVSIYGDAINAAIIEYILGVRKPGQPSSMWFYVHNAGIKSLMDHWAWDALLKEKSLLPV